MGNIEHSKQTPPWWESDEIRRLTEVTEAQSRAIEALRQRNIAERDQLRGAVEALQKAYRQLSNVDPGLGDRRWVRDALDTLRTAVRDHPGGQ